MEFYLKQYSVVHAITFMILYSMFSSRARTKNWPFHLNLVRQKTKGQQKPEDEIFPAPTGRNSLRSWSTLRGGGGAGEVGTLVTRGWLSYSNHLMLCSGTTRWCVMFTSYSNNISCNERIQWKTWAKLGSPRERVGPDGRYGETFYYRTQHDK